MLTTDKQPVAMSIAEAAEQAGVSTATLYSLANQGRLPGARRLGKRIVIHRATFEEWLTSGMGDELEDE
jgi:excisionase family DNA binding protein